MEIKSEIVKKMIVAKKKSYEMNGRPKIYFQNLSLEEREKVTKGHKKQWQALEILFPRLFKGSDGTEMNLDKVKDSLGDEFACRHPVLRNYVELFAAYINELCPGKLTPYQEYIVDDVFACVYAIWKLGQFTAMENIVDWTKDKYGVKNLKELEKYVKILKCDLADYLTKINDEHKLLSIDLSDTNKLAINIMMEMNKRHGDIKFNVKSFSSEGFPKKYKTEARNIGYALGATKNQLDTIFRAKKLKQRKKDY